MADETPIVVNPNALPAMAAVAARYAAALLAGWLIRHGVISDNDTALIEGFVLAASAAGYGIWRTYQRKQELVKVAAEAPDHVAMVKSKP